MSKIREITELFASLALNLKPSDSTAINNDTSNNILVSNLNKSLNLSEQPRVRVLDTALSLMCFTAPQVLDSVIEYFVKTTVSVLSSSINCKVVRLEKDDILRIGGIISRHDIMELMQACADVLGKLDGHDGSEFSGKLSCSLLYAVIRAGISASSFRHVIQLAPILDVKSVDGGCVDLSMLLRYVPKELDLNSQEIPLRLLFWYLDPLILKDELSRILQESTKRPFLCLSTELYERVEWHSTVTCLAICPAMFTETRDLLHNWFLLTGVASILELQMQLVSLVLDIVSRPMRWSISTEVGLTLPFSHAYFPYKHQLLSILAGPLTCGGLLHLVNSMSNSVSRAATKISMVDHRSTWAMVMNFPDWFYFACLLLFSRENFEECLSSTCSREEGPICSAAARYIAWILDPISKSHQDILAEYLTKIARSFTFKKYDSGKHNKTASSYHKKLKKPKIQDYVNREDLKEYDCYIIQLWLEEFQDMYVWYINSTVNSSLKLWQNVLFRRISLGILIGCSDHVSEDGCELLLHYAATGKIFESTNSRDTGSRHERRNSEFPRDSIIGNCNRKEAEKGACIVFRLTDVVENMSASLFETEESEVDFICRVKSRNWRYLLKCVRRLLLLEIDQDDDLMVRDLHNRLVRWRHQGKDAGYKDLDDAIDTLSSSI